MMIAGTLSLTLTKRCTFEAIVIVCKDSGGSPVNLSGYTVKAEVRTVPAATLFIDLAPTITNAGAGEITIPAINDETTDTYAVGGYQWDMLLEETGTDNRQRILAGAFQVINPITDS